MANRGVRKRGLQGLTIATLRDVFNVRNVTRTLEMYVS